MTKYVDVSIKAVLLAVVMMTLMVSAPAFAQVSTAQTGLTNVEDWLTQWIPILATLAIIVAALAWMAGFARMDIAIRIVVGLIVIGSASYIVGMFL